MSSLVPSRGVWAGSVGVLLALLLASAGPAAAAQPEDVTIEAHTERGCPEPVSSSCYFIATGAISDHGTVTLDFVRATALPSPTVGTAQYVRTFEGQLGSFTILLNSMITGTDNVDLFDEQGHWLLVSGTGAYADLLGQGREVGIRDFANQSLDAVYTGKVH